MRQPESPVPDGNIDLFFQQCSWLNAGRRSVRVLHLYRWSGPGKQVNDRGKETEKRHMHERSVPAALTAWMEIAPPGVPAGNSKKRTHFAGQVEKNKGIPADSRASATKALTQQEGRRADFPKKCKTNPIHPELRQTRKCAAAGIFERRRQAGMEIRPFRVAAWQLEKTNPFCRQDQKTKAFQQSREHPATLLCQGFSEEPIAIPGRRADFPKNAKQTQFTWNSNKQGSAPPPASLKTSITTLAEPA